MAKALLGHVGIGMDYRTADELRRLRLRVRELEAELAQVRALQAEMTSVSVSEDDLIALRRPEPALT
jgi:hypothetical protein